MGFLYCIKVTTDGSVELLPWSKGFRFSKAIDCACIEVVHPIMLQAPFLMICDDSGLIDGKPMNNVASYFYGSHMHGQVIAGDVAFAKEVSIEGGLDVYGLTETEVSYLLTVMKCMRIGARLPEDLQ